VLASNAAIWPIDRASAKKPANWNGWPNDKKFSVVLTHDVEKRDGHDSSDKLLELELKHGVRSAFYFVPWRYNVSSALRKKLQDNGFEVGVHGLKHDGKLFRSARVFKKRALIINEYLRDWKAVGFRAPAVHRNYNWMHHLNIEYDSSSFDTDPFEPMPEGMQTIFPFKVRMQQDRESFVELPYTLPQDSTLFVLLQHQNIDAWKKKLDWVAEHGGMVLLITHPDYMYFGEKNDSSCYKYPATHYEEFLQYLQDKYHDQYWLALPHEMAEFWQHTENKCHNE
jgi:hypothetical protein